MSDHPDTDARTDWSAWWATTTPHHTALIWEPTHQGLTYLQLHNRALTIAHALTLQHGLRRGDRVAILAQNSLEHVLLFVAAQKSGWILVPINFRLTAPELAHVLHDSDPALLVHQRALSPLLDTLRREGHPLPTTLLMDDEPTPISPDPPTPPNADASILEPPRFEDPVMILYTSGSTGVPKGAVITHKMLTYNAINTILSLSLTSQDVSFNAAPMYHTGGWNVLTTPLLYCGATALLLDRFDPAQILDLCGRRGITILWGVPTMLRMLSDSPAFPDADLGAVRCAVVGGEPMPEALIHTWHARGIPVRQGFGMTEVGPNCFSLSASDAIAKAGSIGRPNFYIDARLVDDEGAEVGTDQIGELWMRGPVVTPGYWRNPEANEKSFHGAWFATGDLMRRDAEGFYRVVGRKKDMFISGGENVYPPEVERVLLQHPAVAQAAVIGAPDPTWGEVGVAFLVLSTETEEAELLSHCRASLARYKIPRRICVLEALPTGASGKIDKLALRQHLPKVDFVDGHKTPSGTETPHEDRV